MTQETKLAVRSDKEVGIFTSPEIVLENARTAAKALANVLSNKKNPVIINGEQYLEFEDWQTCGQFYGYTVKTGNANPVEVDGVKGAKAQADLIDLKTGMYLGGAEAYCMRDEEYWNTRPKYEWQGEGDKRKRVKVGEEIVSWFQLASMAQTRAGAKAFRNRLAWVVVLAGYKATPAEETTEDTASSAVKERRTVDKSEHYCFTHGVNFFKKGRMTAYAHPIDHTDPVEWCHETTSGEAKPAPKAPKSKSSPVVEQTNDNLPEESEPAPEPESPVDLDWLAETLRIIHWTEGTAKSWIKSQLKVMVEGSLVEVLNSLTREQLQIFLDHLSAMREASGR